VEKIIFWDWTGTLADESEFDKAICKTMEKEYAQKNRISLKDAEKVFKEHLKRLENTWQWHDYSLHGRTLNADWKEAHAVNIGKLIVLPHAEEVLEFSKNRGYHNCLATNANEDVIIFRIEKSI